MTPRKRPLAERLLDALDRFEAWNAARPSWQRIPMGIGLCLGGLLWFLPVLGLWMLPLGLLVLSEDIPWLRRRRERVEAWLRRALLRRRAAGDGTTEQSDAR
jgi:hypothetical protein